MRHRYFGQAARLYLEGGISIIPINARTKRPYSSLLPQARDEAGNLLYYKKAEDGTLEVTTEPTDIKKGTWEPYQKRRATVAELDRWLDCGISAIAMIGGPVSGGLEILDFDVDGYYDRWLDMVREDVAGLPVQRTGGGGIQVAWRCPAPETNKKIAWHPDETSHSGRRIAIETRGVNGYALLPPSIHPSGNYYELLSGRFSQVPTIDQDHRDFLLTCAKALCQAPKTRQELEAERNPSAPREKKEFEGDSVIDAFNAQHSIESMLQRFGYTKCGNGRYSRPGKKDSAGVVVLRDKGKSYHMSSNDPLDSDARGKQQPRSPFDLYAMYEHNGSYRAAVRAAAETLGLQKRKYPRVYRAAP